MTRKVVLATVGSLGDLHPFIAFAAALRERGVSVGLACAAEYQDKVEAAGVAFHPLRPGFDELQRDLAMDRAALTRGVLADSGFLFRKLVLPYLRTAYEDMMTATAGADLILPSSLAFAARLAAEKREIPWIAVVLQPMMFLSAYDPPLMHEAPRFSALLRALGPTPAGVGLRMLKKTVNGLLFRPLHALRADIGLARTAQNPLFDGQFAQPGAIGLYSRLLGDVQPDYPRPTWITGFATFDGETARSTGSDPALEAFLEAGPEPLVFTLGSLIVNSPGSFYQQGVLAARSLGRRAVLLVGEGAHGELAHLNSSEVFVCAYAPHSRLFPRAAAIVHHGGIGTLAQALRSGRPQLIVPHFADQLDNAARAARLGVARILRPQRYSSVAASRELGLLLGDDRHLAQARRAAQSVSAEDGAANAARIVLDTLEDLGRK